MMNASRGPARAAVVGCILAACGCAATVGCSSGADPSSEECLGETAAALRTCAAGATLEGIDVSYYQGTVNWASVKSAGRSFAFARVSDGLDYPDSKFAANWPAMKKAGVLRGAYQYFRPTQDVQAQVDLLVSKLAASGGLRPGDLPPVLDLETSGGLASSTVVARATSWLQKVEAKLGVKPIVYTAAFMSNVIGTSFGAYPLWVANYGATCPLMPSGWTSWSFWQSSDSGNVAGVSGNVDTNFFNGNLTALQAMTLKPAAPETSAPTEDDADGLDLDDLVVEGAHPKDGSQGATLGEADPPKEPAAATIEPCVEP